MKPKHAVTFSSLNAVGLIRFFYGGRIASLGNGGALASVISIESALPGVSPFCAVYLYCRSGLPLPQSRLAPWTPITAFLLLCSTLNNLTVKLYN